jgi:4-amino-4-deoxy-L-arabinose transferase-like glycosyltransferase
VNTHVAWPGSGPESIERPTPRQSAVGRSRRRLASIPRAALACALIGSLNAICWSIITPPFQVPDEPSHFAYTAELAEARQLPIPGTSHYSQEESVVLSDLHHLEVRWHPERRPISSLAEQRRLQRSLDRRLTRRGEGKVGVAASQPPLYYALEVIPYGLGLAGTMLDRLELMRLLTVVFGGLGALLTFMFVRETLPRVPWAWTVGGLSAALAPLLGFMSGAVNPDSMLTAVAAAIFYCLARAFRRGLTRRLAVVIGVLTAVGFLTKLNFIGLAPGVALGLVVLTARAWRSRGRSALCSLAVALSIAASPACLYLLVRVLSGHVGPEIVTSAIADTGRRGSMLEEIVYIWQFYLPRLPGMTTNYFPGLSATRLWFDRSVGLYGWLDTSFPVWVDNIATVPAGLIVLLCARSLVAGRTMLLRRLGELTVYVVMGLGLMTLVGADSYLSLGLEGAYQQPRYLLPMLPLVAAVLALAARGAGRRLGPTVGVLLIVLVLTQNIFSQLLVISRFYG